MKYKNLMIALFPCIIITILGLSCAKNSGDGIRNLSLDSSYTFSRLDSVIQDVLCKDYLYRFNPSDTSKNTILISNEYINPGKVYKGQALPNPFSESELKLKKEYDRPENRLVIAMERKKVNFLRISVIFVDIIKLNFDTTDVKISTEHYSNDRINTSDKFSYFYDKTLCKWVLTDSNYVVY